MTDFEHFDEDEAQQIVYETTEKILGAEKIMKTEKLQKWTELIVRETLEGLSKMKKPFKYIVTCTVNQRDGAGLHTHSSCYFNNDTDTIKSFQWENEAMFCVVSIYVLSIN